MNDDKLHDVVIVGAGVAGALIAKRLTLAGLDVLMLEAGPATAKSLDGYEKHLAQFYAAAGKGPESPWSPALGAPQPDTADLPAGGGYFVQNGPDKYGSSYSRLQGGSTLHWLGVSLRMLPEDFRLRSRHGVGRDWPLGYDDLEPFYRAAEREIGVAADVAEQRYLGLTFPDGYDYPMHKVPPSYSDKTLAAAIDGMEVEIGDERIALKVRTYPAARNSVPRGDYATVGAVDERADGPPGQPLIGGRCQGNTACTPICPVQAKYSALKSLAQADRARLQVRAQAVASNIQVDSATGAVQGVEYQRYDDPKASAYTVGVAKGRVYVLAAHAVENAKLMLASGLGREGSLVGRNLMDHPALYVWGAAPAPVGPFRGPLSTAGIEDLRGGRFRSRQAAFRFDVGNDGWRAATGAPDTTVKDAVMTRRMFGKNLRAQLADQLGRQVRFSVAVEQLPDLGNSVGIDPRYKDPFGNPRPVISYSVGEYTLKGMAAASKVCQQIFRRARIDDRTNYDGGPFFPSAEYQGAVFHYHGMGHFAGTHVMGDDPVTSVVDPDQRSWAHRNLFVVGSGSFPTMGTSNPTLTLAALALRTAERLTAEFAP